MDFHANMQRFQDEMNRLIRDSFPPIDSGSMVVDDTPMLPPHPHQVQQPAAQGNRPGSQHQVAQWGGRAQQTEAAHHGPTSFTPRIAINETEKEVTVHADLPGIKKDDIQIKMEMDSWSSRGRERRRRFATLAHGTWRSVPTDLLCALSDYQGR